jgi:hypothetical protein
MSRLIESQFDFVARYEVEQLDRIDRSGDVNVLWFPNAVALDPQQEMADGPIVRIHPVTGQPWVGVFSGRGYGVPPAARGCLLGWPDERSICVVYAGSAVVVRTDAPRETYEVEAFPIKGVFVVAAHNLVVFSDFTTFACYEADGLRWRADVCSDDAKIVGVEGQPLLGTGFVAGVDQQPFTVDLKTGALTDRH